MDASGNSIWCEEREIKLEDGLPTRPSLKAFVEVLATKATKWDDRVKALEHLREMVTAAKTSKDEHWNGRSFAARLAPLAIPLQVQLTELRSQIIRAACSTVEVLVDVLGADYEATAAEFLPMLFELTGGAKKVMVESARVCTAKIVQCCCEGEGVALSAVLQHVLTTKDARVREHCMSVVSVAFDKWSDEQLSPHCESLQETLIATLQDKSGVCRGFARKSFTIFWRMWPELGDKILEPHTMGGVKKALRAEFTELRGRIDGMQCACCSPKTNLAGAAVGAEVGSAQDQRRPLAARPSMQMMEWRKKQATLVTQDEGPVHVASDSGADATMEELGLGGVLAHALGDRVSPPSDPIHLDLATAAIEATPQKSSDSEPRCDLYVQSPEQLSAAKPPTAVQRTPQTNSPTAAGSVATFATTPVAASTPLGQTPSKSRLLPQPSPGGHLVNERGAFDKQEIQALCTVLATKATKWDDRVKALEHLREMVTAAKTSKDEHWNGRSFAARLAPLAIPLQVQLTELRSQIIRAACSTVEVLVDVLGADYEATAAEFLPMLFELTGGAKKVMVESARVCTAKIVQCCCEGEGVALSAVLQHVLTTKDARVREHCMSVVSVAFDKWSDEQLSPHCESLQETLIATLQDKSGVCRGFARTGLTAFWRMWPELGDKILMSQSEQCQRTIKKQCPALKSAVLAKLGADQPGRTRAGKGSAAREFMRKQRIGRAKAAKQAAGEAAAVETDLGALVAESTSAPEAAAVVEAALEPEAAVSHPMPTHVAATKRHVNPVFGNVEVAESEDAWVAAAMSVLEVKATEPMPADEATEVAHGISVAKTDEATTPTPANISTLPAPVASAVDGTMVERPALELPSPATSPVLQDIGNRQRVATASDFKAAVLFGQGGIAAFARGPIKITTTAAQRKAQMEEWAAMQKERNERMKQEGLI